LTYDEGKKMDPAAAAAAKELLLHPMMLERRGNLNKN
jgi:hypothetical protein